MQEQQHDRNQHRQRLSPNACGWTRTGWTTSSRSRIIGPIRWWCSYIGGAPRDREDSLGRLMRYAGHWALLGYGSGRCVTNRAASTSAASASSTACAISPGARRAGDGLDAGEFCARQRLRHRGTAAALAWVNAPAGEKTVCIISPENQASLALAKSRL
ncbi:hypothetical protein M8494_18060 [Serratia ureilytica]